MGEDSIPGRGSEARLGEGRYWDIRKGVDTGELTCHNKLCMLKLKGSGIYPLGGKQLIVAKRKG